MINSSSAIHAVIGCLESCLLAVTSKAMIAVHIITNLSCGFIWIINLLRLIVNSCCKVFIDLPTFLLYNRIVYKGRNEKC